MDKIELPSRYYLDHFRDLTATLRSIHAHLLEPEHLNFLTTFNKLSEDAQCLFIRMANRKGSIFERSSFEFSNWEELFHVRFARRAEESDFETFLSWAKKPRLQAILKNHNIDFKKSASREELSKLIHDNRSQLHDISRQFEDLVINSAHSLLKYLLFIFFGRVQESLILYTLRDLGIRKAQKAKAIKAKFGSLEEAKSLFFYSTMTERPQHWPMAIGMEALKKKETLLVAMGDELKGQGQKEEALELYLQCLEWPGTEKKARLLWELDRKEECYQVLQQILDNPTGDEELIFAEDFLARKFQKRRTSLLTATLKEAPELTIDESFYRHPEFGVIDHFRKLGLKAHFAENYLWSALFGVIYHDELAALDRHSEFERLPTDLKGKLPVKDLTNWNWQAALQKDFSEAVLFKMDESTKMMLQDLLEEIPMTALQHIINYLAEDFWGRNSGFPDVFVRDEAGVKLIEIKAPGDSLKASQLKQLRELEKAGLRVEVLRVSYQYNPQQTYVVVDLETTGMISPWNRITEIGAVKIQGGQVIETFQTLVNPGRSIPGNIQALTGITNEMVKDAPTFSEVAVQFKEFCEGSIFAAHNVAFDYGFLKLEFDRLEERFVFPYICTKAWAKKYFPKLESYGLAKLSHHFNLNLTNHHRALADAQAAAKLLILINEQRLNNPIHNQSIS